MSQVNELDLDSRSALNRFDNHGFSRSSLVEQILKEREEKVKEDVDNDFDYDLKFLPYSAQAWVTQPAIIYASDLWNQINEHLLNH